MKKLIYFGLILILLSSCIMGEDEIYLIPKGYEGPIIVKFDEVDGIPVKKEGNTRVYEIPQSGILNSSGHLQEGYRNIEYYYIDGLGNRTAIESVQIQLLDEEEKATDEPKVYRLLVYGSGDISFIIGKLKDSEKHWSALEELKKEVFKDGTVIIHAKEKE